MTDFERIVALAKERDDLRGRLARLDRAIRHEMTDLLDAVGEPTTTRERLIRARARNTLAALDAAR